MTIPGGIDAVTPLDFDADGDIDFAAVLSGPGTGVACLFRNDLGLLVQTPWSVPLPVTTESAQSADLNQDGWPDLAILSRWSNSVRVFLGDGHAQFQPVPAIAVPEYPVSLRIADVDADGCLDLVTASTDGHSITILRGNCDGTFLPPDRYLSPFDPNAIDVADLNGDGALDVSVSSYTSSCVSTLLNSGPFVRVSEQPADQLLFAGQTAALRAAGTSINGGSLLYRWHRDNAPLSDGPTPSGSTISNSDGPELSINNISPQDFGRYKCVISNGCGRAMTRPATLRVAAPPCNADFDGDSDSATDADIEAFFACLNGHCCPTCGSADFNNDGDTGTDADIESFFRVLAGGDC
jgi:hypothetical protein